MANFILFTHHTVQNVKGSTVRFMRPYEMADLLFAYQTFINNFLSSWFK